MRVSYRMETLLEVLMTKKVMMNQANLKIILDKSWMKVASNKVRKNQNREMWKVMMEAMKVKARLVRTQIRSKSKTNKVKITKSMNLR